jgi:hypothetical protein
MTTDRARISNENLNFRRPVLEAPRDQRVTENKNRLEMRQQSSSLPTDFEKSSGIPTERHQLSKTIQYYQTVVLATLAPG